MARQRVANHKGEKDWQDIGARQPAPVGPMGEKHSHGAPMEEESIFGAYFSTPGHRPLTSHVHDDVETGYAQS